MPTDAPAGQARASPGAGLAPLSAITDVAGVAVGHGALIEEDGTRTGATAIRPHDGSLPARSVPPGLDVLNGYGKFASATRIA